MNVKLSFHRHSLPAFCHWPGFFSGVFSPFLHTVLGINLISLSRFLCSDCRLAEEARRSPVRLFVRGLTDFFFHCLLQGHRHVNVVLSDFTSPFLCLPSLVVKLKSPPTFWHHALEVNERLHSSGGAEDQTCALAFVDCQKVQTAVVLGLSNSLCEHLVCPTACAAS